MIPACSRTPELRRVQYWLSHKECKPLRDCEVQRVRRRLCFRRNRVRPTNYRSCNAMVSKSNLFMHRQTVRIKKRGFEVIARTLSLRLDHCVVQGGKSCFDRRYGRALPRCDRRCGFAFLPQRASGRGQYQGRNCNPGHDRLHGLRATSKAGRGPTPNGIDFGCNRSNKACIHV